MQPSIIVLDLNKYELDYKIKYTIILVIYKVPQIYKFRQKYYKVNMLFKIYSKLVGFPKKERTKSSPSHIPPVISLF